MKDLMEDLFEYRQKYEEQQKLLEIETAHELTKEMNREADKYAKLASLAFSDEIYTIKNVLRGRYLHLTYAAKDAQKWLSMQSEKFDGRKKCEEKDQFDYLTSQIEDLLGVEIKLTGISVFGYDESAYYVRFNVKNDFSEREFELTIPETEKLSKNNINELDYGKLKILFRMSSESCSWNFVCTSYDKDELKAKFKEFLTPKPV